MKYYEVKELKVVYKIYNIKVFAWQYPVLNDFVYHYAAYKKVCSAYTSFQGDQQFWIRTADSHLKTSVIAWCMVFGADSNSIHWKKTIEEEEDEDKNLKAEEFRKIIFETNNLDQASWSTYWESIIGFRNGFIAHREIDNKKPVPYLGKALNIAFEYDIWIRKIMKPVIFGSPTLKESYSEYSKNIEDTLNIIL